MVDTCIIGAGLAGLACARELHRAGVSFQILEAEDRPGGRVQTDLYEGFQLDRGFQILLAAYPEAQRVLDYGALELCDFEPGALVHFGGRLHQVSDPLRRPGRALATLAGAAHAICFLCAVALPRAAVALAVLLPLALLLRVLVLVFR